MKLLGVLSVKGGVGKSTVAIETAYALQRRGLRVGILDSDFTAPNIPIMMGCDNKKPRRGKGNIVIPIEHNGIRVISWSMVWPQDSAVMIEDKQVDSDDLMYAVSMLKAGKTDAAIKYLTQLAEDPGGAISHLRLLFESGNIDWGDTDFLVVDTAPTSSGTVRAVVEAGLWGAILVTHPSKPSLADLRRTIDMFRKKQAPIIGLISNQGTRSGLPQYDLTDEDIERFAVEKGIPFITAIPHDDNLAPYFDRVAEFVLNCQPIVLPQKVVDEAEAMRTMKGITKLIDLMEALR